MFQRHYYEDHHSVKGKWMSGDFHQQTNYTDGSEPFFDVMEKNVDYGLDWWANSEHGVERNRDGNGNYWDEYKEGYSFDETEPKIKYTHKSYPDMHADAVAAYAWMHDQKDAGLIEDGWIVFAHIVRDGPWTTENGGGYNIEHF